MPNTDRPFDALRLPGFRTFLLTFLLTMMADNVEHVISYWVAFQKFHSPALGGFAVISHWVPYLVFSVPVGALNDRFDSRRLIQFGAGLFMLVSVGWGYFFVSGTLQMWHAMVLLSLHGCAGVFWLTSSQVLLYDVVGGARIASAVRLNASARYLGMLVGPGVGSLILRTLGPNYGMFLNATFYSPLIVWLIAAPYGRHFRSGEGPRRAVRGLADILETVRNVRGLPVLLAMIVLAGGASFFVGNSYQAQMPTFATDLGHGDPGAAYTALLGADAAGALFAGLLLESGRSLLRTETSAALKLAALWACALGAFALARSYPFALVCLFLAGFFELSFSSMTQTIVQLQAPSEIRGRVLGLFNMSSAGLRAFSGVTVGLVGSMLGVHVSLAVAAGAFMLVAVALLARLPSSAKAA
ncbi:MAG TPA: MFS transporter [Polyangiaceae bacterium]|nr:MFS transporter [Polyangiaceae bacterium]HYQ30421.1 MFS transporter [Polyangiaceae bacterium]